MVFDQGLYRFIVSRHRRQIITKMLRLKRQIKYLLIELVLITSSYSFFTTPGPYNDPFNFGMFDAEPNTNTGSFGNSVVRPNRPAVNSGFNVQNNMGTKNVFGVQPGTSRSTNTAPKKKENCMDVQSTSCDKYSFNYTTNPFKNYPGHKSVKEADRVMASLFSKITVCRIKREYAEAITCAMHIPYCLETGKSFPPCKEDCKEMISGCNVPKIPGYEDALGICTLFPSRKSKSCFFIPELNL